MSAIELLKPMLNDGIHLTNFFNGRLLTAEDLDTEQYANRQQHQQLGRAIGEGIIDGLEVQMASSTPPAAGTPSTLVTVSAGLALNHLGQALSLPADTDVALVPQGEQLVVDAGLFAACEPPQTKDVPIGTGVYILVLTPASGFEGRAPMSGLSVQGATSPTCGSKYVVEGVKFGLIWLDVSNLPGISDNARNLLTQLMPLSDAASLSKLRNLLAHLCFGTEEREVLFSDPFSQVGKSPARDYGVLATLRSLGKLTDCDVPLALLYWTMSGIQFVDMGSVRRRPLSGPPTQSWTLALGGGYPALGEAMSIQFQEHIAQITNARTSQAQLAAIGAIDYFQYLPAIGIIPIVGANLTRGFDYLKFFQNIPHRDPVFIDGAKVEHLIRDSLSYPPIKLDSNPNNQEMAWLYLVRENIQTIAENPFNALQAYMIFTSGHIPYQGDARYDLARWGYSNFSSVLAH